MRIMGTDLPRRHSGDGDAWRQYVTDDDGICSDCDIIGQFHTPDNPGTAS